MAAFKVKRAEKQREVPPEEFYGTRGEVARDTHHLVLRFLANVAAAAAASGPEEGLGPWKVGV